MLSDVWGDLLTGYNGKTVTSDAIGNITSDGTRTYTWEHGRELASLTKDGVTWTFTYDANGMRTGRTDGTNTYEYVYDGDKLMQMTKNGEVIRFTYVGDIPMTMTYDGETYYYVVNGQGDVTGLTDSTGKLVIGYLHNGWRTSFYTLEDSELSPILFNINPLIYRGYVFDRETQLYYLQSRYYDPELGRFISADAYTSTGQGLLGNNMFAYCGNNPVCNVDSSGMFFFTVLGATVGAAFGALSALIEGKDGDEFKASVLAGATSGAISGAAADVLLITGGTAGAVALTMAGAGAIGAVASNAVEAKVTGTEINWATTGSDVFWDASFGALFGYMGGPIKSQLGTFTKKGVLKAISYIASKELNDIGSSIGEEILGNITAGIGRFTGEVYYNRFFDSFDTYE